MRPHTALEPALLRDVTHEWLQATRSGVVAPDTVGLALSASFQSAANNALAAAASVAVVAATGAEAFDALLGMPAATAAAADPVDDGGGLVARTHGSAQLYLALAFLSVDARMPVLGQLRAATSARATGNPSPAEPPYMPDARRALQTYRDAVIAGVAYWDHAYLLVAAVHEVSPRGGYP